MKRNMEWETINIEVDHIKSKKFGGKNSYDNLQLLHGHCHDHKSNES